VALLVAAWRRLVAKPVSDPQRLTWRGGPTKPCGSKQRWSRAVTRVQRHHAHSTYTSGRAATIHPNMEPLFNLPCFESGQRPFAVEVHSKSRNRGASRSSHVRRENWCRCCARARWQWRRRRNRYWWGRGILGPGGSWGGGKCDGGRRWCLGFNGFWWLLDSRFDKPNAALRR